MIKNEESFMNKIRSIDLMNTIEILKTKRPVFFSEADFQFALAWELQKAIADAEIRMEFCPAEIDHSMHIDILAKCYNNWFPIELKYMTFECKAFSNDEKYLLKSHGAQDIRRYDFLKDIMRIEKLLKADARYSTGFAILLTNDPAYWIIQKKKNTCDSAFRIHEGLILCGELKWSDNTGKGTNVGREKPVILQGKYEMCWKDYSRISDIKGGQFRYLLVEIKSK